VLALLFLALAASAAGSDPVVAPARVRPGDAFLLTVPGAAPPAAAVAGRPVQFFPIPGGHRALVPLPLEQEPGTLAVEVAREGEPPASAALEVAPGDFAEKRLRVSEKFVRPPPPKVRQRMEADQRAFDRAFAQPASPPLFGAGFGWPREDEVTGRFGDKRTLNGKKQSRHYGLDLGGATGAPVAATNAGRVVLVRDCWASGLSVVLFHGAGTFSTYYHLSKALVREGDEVERGQRIAQVGKSGRVTGPHLHWGVKVAGLYVDPESVLRLPLGEPSAPGLAPAAAAAPQ
jgi:murein DD-endopeptidase MepM/ murein hydrolase activator NlpD